LTPLPIPLPDG
jgi:hypothetical protein